MQAAILANSLRRRTSEVEMPRASSETNLRTYDTPEVAAHYALLDYLTPGERLLFETYIKPGSVVLDLGVGGGRTTPYLASRASRYIGVDYAPAMIEACQAKFPGVEFKVADASDLSAFPDSSFDAVVFAFNGIDYVLPDQARRRCFEHICRLLRPGGVLIFSSHNARAIFVRPRWKHERLRRLAEEWSRGSRSLCAVFFSVLVPARVVTAFLQAAWSSLPPLIGRPLAPFFWRGEGNHVDSAHGGLLTHYSTPARVIDELDALHLQFERIVGEEYPDSSHALSTDWYYYVFAKPGRDQAGGR
jgi:SAM-dependent methyltransferase